VLVSTLEDAAQLIPIKVGDFDEPAVGASAPLRHPDAGASLPRQTSCEAGAAKWTDYVEKLLS